MLGPSLGTTATNLWSSAAKWLTDHFRVLAWDLPGHGASPAPDSAVTIEGLAAGVLELVEGTGSFHYAGDSVGGAVGLQLFLDAHDRVSSATLLCTGARIGTPPMWRERAALARTSGTAGLVAASAQRWFGPGFLDREPAAGEALLRALTHTDAEGYAGVCDALAAFDVRGRLS
ncbi:MAG: hypothetical protein ABS81_04405 [Pseudonocardia sp. SCN 72-86]|nr:MAG: hypothetical protein ABS81_04405 [Pseudonocardia sp. SCN 72-86]